jgi:outer membrane protein assembly factor BamB
MQEWLFTSPPGVIPVLINPIAVLFAVLPGIFMALVSLLKPKSIKAGLIMLWRMKLQVAVLAVVVFGLVQGAKMIFPSSTAATGEAEAALVDWPHFRGDATRRGWIRDGLGDPVTGGLNWTFREGSQLFIASPAVVGNRLYIPSVTIGAFGGLSGAIYCLDADTGGLVWRGGPSDYRGSFSSAVVEGDYLVVGEGLHATNDARAICMDISDESAPKVLWTFRSNSHIEGTPTIDQGRVYFTAGNDGIYGLDLETGEKLWHLPGEDFHDPETSILAHDGKVYIGLGFGRNGQAVVQVDGATGEVLHRIETPYPVFGPPAIHNGRLYIGMGNGDFVFPAEQRVDYVINMLRNQGVGEEELTERRKTLGPAGAVWAFDVETMERVWEYPTNRTILSAITVTHEGLYFASRTGGVYHLDFDGAQLAYWNAGEPVVSSMSVTDAHVYLMTSNGMFYVLRSDDLSPVWDLRLSTGTMNFSSPAVARGQIYVGTEAAGLVSLGQPDDASRVEIWSGPGGGPRRGGRADDAPLPAFGAYESHHPETAMGDAGATLLSVSPLVVDDRLVTVFAAPQPRVEVSESGNRWTRELEAPALETAVFGDTLAIHVGGDIPKLLLLDLRSGDPIATHALDPNTPPLLSATPWGFLARLDADSLSLMDAGGSIAGHIAAAHLSFPPVLTSNLLVVVRNGAHELAVLDRPTGKTLWSIGLPGEAAGGPILDGHRVFVPTARGLLAHDLATGLPVEEWQAPPDPLSDSLVMDRTLIAGITAEGHMLALDRATGREVARHPGARAGHMPLLERGRVLWLTDTGVRAMDRDTPQAPPAEWVDYSWIGTPTTGMIAHRSTLYLGLTDWGLVQFGEEK